MECVDIEDIAFEVYYALDRVEVEEVWDRSGSTRDGYVDPTEMAWQIFEEALDPFCEELRKYQRLSMYDEAKKCCLGILKGIYKFEKESTSEYKDWAVDAPREYFKQVLKEWKNERNYSGMLICLPIAVLYFLARKITAEGAEERRVFNRSSPLRVLCG